MRFTVTPADFKNSAWNNLCGLAHIGTSMGTAYAINKAAHRLFKAQPNSYKSYAIKACAFAAGATVSSYLMPHTILRSFTGRKASEIIAVCSVTCIVFPPAGVCIEGAFTGWVGGQGLLRAYGVLSAVLGAFA